MRHQAWKKWIRWGLGAVLALDAVLLFFVWRNGGEKSQVQALGRFRLQHELWSADVGRARAIRDQLPEVQRKGARFVAEQLLPASGGYSSIVADLGEIAGDAHVANPDLTFGERKIGEHGLVEVRVSATVEGDYANLVRFINGLERSENFYLLESLSLASSTSGGIKLNLELKTYFRS